LAQERQGMHSGKRDVPEVAATLLQATPCKLKRFRTTADQELALLGATPVLAAATVVGSAAVVSAACRKRIPVEQVAVAAAGALECIWSRDLGGVLAAAVVGSAATVAAAHRPRLYADSAAEEGISAGGIAAAASGSLGSAARVVITPADLEPHPTPRLVDLHTGAIHVLPNEGSLSIGRRADNSIVIPVPAVSGRHCNLICSDNSVEVEDVSTNGSYISNASAPRGQRLSQQTVLQHEDRLALAHCGGPALLFLAANSELGVAFAEGVP